MVFGADNFKSETASTPKVHKLKIVVNYKPLIQVSDVDNRRSVNYANLFWGIKRKD